MPNSINHHHRNLGRKHIKERSGEILELLKDLHKCTHTFVLNGLELEAITTEKDFGMMMDYEFLQLLNRLYVQVDPKPALAPAQNWRKLGPYYQLLFHEL